MKLQKFLLLSRLAFSFMPLAISQAQPAIESTVISPEGSSAVITVNGIAHEATPYPYPVRFLSLNVEDETVRMAFMDVAPTGTATGRVALLLHGKNFGGDYWRGPASALAAAGYRVVIPDQLGFGKSSKPDINYSFDLLAQNTATLLDELNIDNAAVIGHSMGGMLAVRFARNYPQRTTQLVLENPIGLEDYRFKAPPQTIQQAYEAELNNNNPANITAFYRRYFVNPGTQFDYLAVPRIAVTRSGEYPRWAKSAALTYQMIYQQPVRHEFPLIKAPTLLVIGQEDRTAIGKNLVSEEVGKTMGQYPQLGRAAARDIPGSKLVELPNTGHIPHIEAPAQFNTILLNFLNTSS
jgi:pimeloyl-ACP methyl ester carboxylesterase